MPASSCQSGLVWWEGSCSSQHTGQWFELAMGGGLSYSPAFPICTARRVSLPCSTDFSFLGILLTFFSFSSLSIPSWLLRGWISKATPSWVFARVDTQMGQVSRQGCRSEWQAGGRQDAPLSFSWDVPQAPDLSSDHSSLVPEVGLH